MPPPPEEELLRRGTRHIRSALSSARDRELFGRLRAELSQGALGIAGRKREGPWTWAGGVGDALSMRSPWRPSVEDEQLADLESSGKGAHAGVLRRMAETFGVPPEMWWANLYDDASIGCDFHCDTLKHDAITVSASFGVTRELVFRHTATGREFSFCLQNGDVFAFDATVDSAFVHGVYPAKDVEGARISIIAVCRTTGGLHGSPGRRQRQSCLEVRPDGCIQLTSLDDLRKQQETWMRNQALLYEGCEGVAPTEGGPTLPSPVEPPEQRDPERDGRQQPLEAGLRLVPPGQAAPPSAAPRAAAAAAPGAGAGAGRGAARAAARRLSRGQALRMEEDLIQGFQDAAFQEKLHAAWRAAGSSRAAKVKARQDLCLPVQGPIIAKYGFEASRRGVLESLAAVRMDFLHDREVMDKATYLSWLVDPALQKGAPCD